MGAWGRGEGSVGDAGESKGDRTEDWGDGRMLVGDRGGGIGEIKMGLFFWIWGCYNRVIGFLCMCGGYIWNRKRRCVI